MVEVACDQRNFRSLTPEVALAAEGACCKDIRREAAGWLVEASDVGVTWTGDGGGRTSGERCEGMSALAESKVVFVRKNGLGPVVSESKGL